MPLVSTWGRSARKLAPGQFVWLNLALGVGHFVTVLSAGAFLPMLPYVAGTLGEGLAYAVWGQSNYFTAMGAAFLISRPLTRRHGARAVALWGYVLFAAAAAAVPLSTFNCALYVCARSAQGFAAGLCITPSLALLLEHYKTERQALGVSLWGLALFMPFSIGPALGGLCAYVLGDWRWLFVLSAAAATWVAAMLWALTGRRLDASGVHVPLRTPVLLFALFACAAMALQMTFDVGLLSALTSREATWQPLAALALVATLVFVFCNAGARAPLIDNALFACPDYPLGLALLCLAFMGLQSSIVQYLIRLQLVDGYTAWHAGLLFLPLFVMSKPANLLAQRALRAGTDPRLLASVAALAMAASFAWMAGIARPAPWLALLWPQFLEGAALGFLFAGINACALRHVPPALQLHAVDVLNTLRNLAAGLAITISDIGWDHLAARHRLALVAEDSGNAARFVASLTPGLRPDMLMRQLSSRVGQQAAWLNMSVLCAWLTALFALVAALVWLTRAEPPVRHVPRLDNIVSNLGEEP